MRLAKGLQPSAFLKDVAKCSGDVWMCSREGDRLNLKSQLCQYLFVSIMLKPELLSCCWIECDQEKDEKMLKPLWNMEN